MHIVVLSTIIYIIVLESEAQRYLLARRWILADFGISVIRFLSSCFLVARLMLFYFFLYGVSIIKSTNVRLHMYNSISYKLINVTSFLIYAVCF